MCTFYDVAGAVVSAFRAVGNSLVDHAWPHVAGLVNQAGILRHAPDANDRLGRYPEAEVLVPAVAEGLLVRGVRLNVRAVCQAKVAAVPTHRVSISSTVPPAS